MVYSFGFNSLADTERSFFSFEMLLEELSHTCLDIFVLQASYITVQQGTFAGFEDTFMLLAFSYFIIGAKTFSVM